MGVSIGKEKKDPKVAEKIIRTLSLGLTPYQWGSPKGFFKKLLIWGDASVIQKFSPRLPPVHPSLTRMCWFALLTTSRDIAGGHSWSPVHIPIAILTKRSEQNFGNALLCDHLLRASCTSHKLTDHSPIMQPLPGKKWSKDRYFEKFQKNQSSPRMNFSKSEFFPENFPVLVTEKMKHTKSTLN